MPVALKLVNSPQAGTDSAPSSADTQDFRAGFATEVTRESEELVEWVYYNSAGHRTSLARCHSDGRVDYPAVGPGWPFNLGSAGAIGQQVW